ncbi:hypothetical protein CVT24_012989 [Panaeolus cyanescens]|uniref:G domain-containing protein n=1 Tax=Panaeolus cyanescens TaxID=181874 RepID=A0A409WA70_9AGAR|nr:hypothetical protein CVT24_012989 [Panaeolus cyanescens]
MDKIIETGDVSVQRWTGKVPLFTTNILLLGPTGSGKSSFIEALAGNGHKLGISGGTLESVTQDVQAFKILNMCLKFEEGSLWPSNDLYLIDTPGFSDSKLSEMSTFRKINRWESETGSISQIFYFCRITDTRIPGTARRLIKLIQSLGVDSKALTIVTSMWDTIGRKDALKRAEDHYDQLRDVIWKDEIQKGATIVKFNNTHTSAKEILLGMRNGAVVSRYSFYFYDPEKPTAPLVLDELLVRVQNVILERQALQQDTLRFLHTQDFQLKSMVTTSLADVNSRIMDYVDQLLDYGPTGPIPRQFAILIYRCLLGITMSSQAFVHEIQIASKYSPSSARNELKAMRQAAKCVFMHVYLGLLVFGVPSAEFQPFSPSISLGPAERIKLEVLCKAKRVERRLKNRYTPFIEALAGSGQNLGISGGTLESVTQDIEAFKVVNMIFGAWPVFLVDSPGFLDNRMSEFAIVKKVSIWCRQNWKINHVFYFCRATDTRFPGSARRIMDIIKLLLLDPSAMTLVTTMWDGIRREEALNRAESNFSQLLQDHNIWRDEIKKGGRAVKFLNTQSSAIDILSAEYASAFTPQSRFNPHLNRFMGISLIAEAAERIENADAQRKAILDDCFEVFSLYSDPHLETNIDRDVEAVLISSLRDVDMRLGSYHSEVVDSVGTDERCAIVEPDPAVFTYKCLLYYMRTHMKLLGIIQRVSLSASPDIVEHLEATLRVAKTNFQQAYQKLCDSIPMPPSLETRFHPFSQSEFITITFPSSSHPQNGQLPADNSATAGTREKVSYSALRILLATNPKQIELSGKELEDFFLHTLKEASRSDISALGGIILPNDDEDVQRILAPPSPPPYNT